MAFEFVTLPRGSSFSRSFAGFVDEFGQPAGDLTGWVFGTVVKALPLEPLAGAELQAYFDAAPEVLVRTHAQFAIASGTAGFVFSAAELAGLALGTSYYVVTRAKSPGGFSSEIDTLLLSLTPSVPQTL